MTGPFRQRVVDLCRARASLQGDVERILLASAPDHAALRLLRELAQDLKQDAHSLLVTVLFEDGAPALADAADELLTKICEVVQQVDARLGP